MLAKVSDNGVTLHCRRSMLESYGNHESLAAGVLAMTVGFFTWLTLLQRFNLSYLYPFEGLDRVILVFGAWLFLRENMTRDLWIGVTLICFGTILVSAT